MHDLRHLSDVAGGFLDTYDIVHVLYKVGQCSRLDVASCAARHIVEDRRELHLAADCGVVCDQPLLGGFVVIWRYEKQSVRSVLLRLFRQLDRCCGAVGTCSGDDRDAVFYTFYSEADRLHVLSLCHSGRFAGSAADDDGICAACDLLLQYLIQFIIVDLKILFHRCDDGYTCSFKNCHSIFLLDLACCPRVCRISGYS